MYPHHRGAGRPGGIGGGTGAEFTRLLTECDAVAYEKIAEAVGADYVYRGFFGAICRWDGEGPTGVVKVTFNWFETGSLDHERAAAEGLGYEIENTTIEAGGHCRCADPAIRCRAGSVPGRRRPASSAGGCSTPPGERTRVKLLLRWPGSH